MATVHSHLASAASSILMGAIYGSYCIHSTLHHLLVVPYRAPTKQPSATMSGEQQRHLTVVTGADSGMGRALVQRLLLSLAERSSTATPSSLHVVAVCLTDAAVQKLTGGDGDDDKRPQQHLTAIQCNITQDADVARVTHTQCA